MSIFAIYPYSNAEVIQDTSMMPKQDEQEIVEETEAQEF